jgi:metallophosphoesterase (TIGR00282 family)
MRMLFLGDVAGRAGRSAVIDKLPGLIDKLELDFVAINGENAAGGFGITEDICQALLDAGADVVTGGNHSWDQREALVFIERQDRLLRPLNYPDGTPGRGAGIFVARNGMRVLVINAMGTVFMPDLEPPISAVDNELASCPLGEQADVVIIDFHAEASSEKQAFAHHVDGRASLVVGTHTHVPTADHQILPAGTAYITDIGMCGAYDSVIGMDKAEPINRFIRRIPRERFIPATGSATLSGLMVVTDDDTGLALRAEPLRQGGILSQTLPDI